MSSPGLSALRGGGKGEGLCGHDGLVKAVTEYLLGGSGLLDR